MSISHAVRRIPLAEDQPWMKPDEVASAFGWGRVSVYRRIHDGTLPSVRNGRLLFIPTAFVRRLAELD